MSLLSDSIYGELMEKKTMYFPTVFRNYELSNLRIMWNVSSHSTSLRQNKYLLYYNVILFRYSGVPGQKEIQATVAAEKRGMCFTTENDPRIYM